MYIKSYIVEACLEMSQVPPRAELTYEVITWFILGVSLLPHVSSSCNIIISCNGSYRLLLWRAQ